MGARHEVQLRWADLDLLGHVNNVRLMELLQEARVFFAQDLAREAGINDAQVLREGFRQVIARLEVDFVRPGELADGSLFVESWVERVGNSSYVLAHRVTNPAGETVIKATSVMVCFDLEAGRSVPLPPGWRALLELPSSGESSDTA